MTDMKATVDSLLEESVAAGDVPAWPPWSADPTASATRGGPAAWASRTVPGR